MIRIIKYLLILLLFVFFFPKNCFADISEDINKLGEQIAQIDASIKPLKNESAGLQQKITTARNQIALAEKQTQALNQNLIDKEADLEIQKTLMGERVKQYYINSKKYNPFIIFLTNTESSSMIRQFSWYQSIITQDKVMISKYGNEINTLNNNKTELEKQKVKLAELKSNMESRFSFLSGEIKKAETYKAELSAKQQALIAEKTAMFNTSVGDVSSSDDPASRSDYNPGFAPAFAVFSFGAPHRKGMSQFGAFGRAKNGQNYETILKAYYGDIKIEKIDSPGSIRTSIETLPFEDNYLVGIAEMPATWGGEGGMEALKAQAIAARTYALAYTDYAKKSICVTEACQVYKSSRYHSPGLWKDAVQATRGLVIKSNKTNNIFSTMYASTAGGALYSYTSLDHQTPQIWDTTCGNQSCWPNDSYEKIAGSSWYYKGWYKSRSNNAYGRSHPWLNNEEFSDIVNAVLYFSKTKDSSHLSQNQNCINSCDSDAWSRDELRRQVADKRGPISSINSVSVDYSTGGYTAAVHISTDKGNFDFNGDDFKQIFTLRAPGAITAKSALFNIEKK